MASRPADCPKCRAPLSMGDRVCPFCYTRVDGMTGGTLVAVILIGIVVAVLVFLRAVSRTGADGLLGQ